MNRKNTHKGVIKPTAMKERKVFLICTAHHADPLPPRLLVCFLQVSMFCHGARVGFYQGDISLLMDDIKTLKPTFFPVVPRLLNRIYDKVGVKPTKVTSNELYRHFSYMQSIVGAEPPPNIHKGLIMNHYQYI